MDDPNRDPDSIATDDKMSTDRQKLVAALLFGLDHSDDSTLHDLDDSHSRFDSAQQPPMLQKMKTSKPSSIESILSFIDRCIPSSSSKELRATPLYQSVHHALRFQRDQYLVGSDYAAWRNRRGRPARILPYDSTALGHQQLRPLVAPFLVSETVVRALTPLIAYELPVATFPVIAGAAIQLVESQQDVLNQTVKQSLLQLLQNPQNRQALKRSIASYNGCSDVSDGDESKQTK